MSVHFQPVPQKENQIIIDLPPSSSNLSCLTRRNIVIGAVGIGVTIAAATAYFLTANNAFTETAFSTKNTESSIDQSILSLCNTAQYVETNDYTHCKNAFEAHLEKFTSCGKMLCECIYKVRDLFTECPDEVRSLFLSSNETCKKIEAIAQGCIEFMEIGKKQTRDGSIYCYIGDSI